MENTNCNAENAKTFRLRWEGAHPPPAPTPYGQQAGHARLRRGLLYNVTYLSNGLRTGLDPYYLYIVHTFDWIKPRLSVGNVVIQAADLIVWILKWIWHVLV